MPQYDAIVQQVIQSVAPELWWLLIQAIGTAIACLALYKIVNQITSYFFVRFDKELGKNVEVIINGRKGYITHISIRHLIIRFKEQGECHSEMIIPITKVLSKEWEIVRKVK